jgi:acetolactate synthase-1/2/3 large subunit
VASGAATWRQRGGFQALDHLEAARPFTKWQSQVTQPAQLPWALRRAFFMATAGAPGPVILEIPDGMAAPDAAPVADLLAPAPRSQADPALVAQAVELCLAAERPAFLVGGGALRSGARDELLALADRLSAALFTTASGRGLIPESNPSLLGLAGLYLLPEARERLAAADLVLVWGSRLEETATLGWTSPHPEARIIQIDAAPESLGNGYPGSLCLLGDCALVARQFLAALAGSPERTNQPWAMQVAASRTRLEAEAAEYRSAVLPAAVPQMVAQVFGSELVLAQENGLLDIWGFHFPVLQLPPGGRVITPAEQTAMGCSAAAALGAAVATKGPVACITGDGAIHFVLSDLVTAVAERLGVTYVMLENGGYGWVRYRQSQTGGGLGSTFHVGQQLEEIARSAGLVAWTAPDAASLQERLQEALALNRAGRPALIRVPCPKDQIPPGVLYAYGPPGPSAGR